MTPAPSPRFGVQFARQARLARFNPIRSLTPESLARQLDAFQSGWLGEFALTADAIRRRDDMVSAALSKREKAVSRRSWNILVVEGLDTPAEKEEAARHQAALQYFYDHLTATHALEQNQRGGTSLLARQMMSAVALRYAVHEIVWQPTRDPRTGEDRLTATFTHVPLWFFENTTGRLRFIDSAFGGVAEGQPMDPREWLVTVGEGIMEPISVAYMFKRLSLHDWVAYNEKFGMPGLHGKTSAAEGTDAWNTLVEAVESFGQDWACVTNEDARIELVRAEAASFIPFPPLIERMDRAIAAICRGADLSTMSAGQGEGSGASLQGDESLLLEEDDAQLITEALDDVSRTVIRQLFGTDTPLAYLQIIVPRPKTTDDTIKKIEFLVRHGVPVSIDYARQELDIPAPPEDATEEDLLTAPAAPELAQPGGFGLPPAAFPRLANAEIKAFRQTAVAALARAQADDLKPLVMRLEKILELPDASLPSALDALRADLPRLAREVLARDEARAAWEEILGTALVDAAATAAQSRTA